MISEKELSASTIHHIHHNSNDHTDNKIKIYSMKDIVMVYPKYEDGKMKWFFIHLWRRIVFMISFFLTAVLYYFIGSHIPVFCIILYSIPKTHELMMGMAFIVVCFTFGFSNFHLPVSYVLGQYDYFYLKCSRHMIQKRFLSKDYIFKRIATSKSTVSSLTPYYYKEKENNHYRIFFYIIITMIITSFVTIVMTTIIITVFLFIVLAILASKPS
ncbi:unnamed protein product [Cunninghamella blakesleeana]